MSLSRVLLAGVVDENVELPRKHRSSVARDIVACRLLAPDPLRRCHRTATLAPDNLGGGLFCALVMLAQIGDDDVRAPSRASRAATAPSARRYLRR